MMEEKIGKLQCHFNWGLMKRVDKVQWKPLIALDPQSRINYLKIDSKCNPNITMEANLFIAFLYTQLKPPNYEEASNVIEKVLHDIDKMLHEAQEKHHGFQIVALGNKVHILKLQGPNDKLNVAELLDKIDAMDASSKKTQAFIYGIQAYACSMLGEGLHEMGLQMFETARGLDPEHYAWPMGIAIMAGRLQRLAEGCKSQPTQMEYENMLEAVRLSGEQEPLPLLFLADIYMSKGGRNECTLYSGNDNFCLNEARKLYLKAYKLSPNHVLVLSKCGKAFIFFGDEDFAEMCLLKSIEIDHGNAVTFRSLGLLYEHSKKKGNMRLAEEYFKKAAVRWERSNVHSDLDLIRIDRKIRKTTASIEPLLKLESKYADDERSLVVVTAAIVKQKEYLSKKNVPRLHGAHNRNEQSTLRSTQKERQPNRNTILQPLPNLPVLDINLARQILASVPSLIEVQQPQSPHTTPCNPESSSYNSGIQLQNPSHVARKTSQYELHLQSLPTRKVEQQFEKSNTSKVHVLDFKTEDQSSEQAREENKHLKRPSSDGRPEEPASSSRIKIKTFPNKEHQEKKARDFCYPPRSGFKPKSTQAPQEAVFPGKPKLQQSTKTTKNSKTTLPSDNTKPHPESKSVGQHQVQHSRKQLKCQDNKIQQQSPSANNDSVKSSTGGRIKVKTTTRFK